MPGTSFFERWVRQLVSSFARSFFRIREEISPSTPTPKKTPWITSTFATFWQLHGHFKCPFVHIICNWLLKQLNRGGRHVRNAFKTRKNNDRQKHARGWGDGEGVIFLVRNVTFVWASIFFTVTEINTATKMLVCAEPNFHDLATPNHAPWWGPRAILSAQKPAKLKSP